MVDAVGEGEGIGVQGEGVDAVAKLGGEGEEVGCCGGGGGGGGWHCE